VGKRLQIFFFQTHAFDRFAVDDYLVTMIVVVMIIKQY
jgi:hypothetical protein